MLRRMCLGWLGFALAALLAGGCDDDRPYDPYENAGSSCADASECYPGIPPADVAGTIVCMDRVEGGYCTHTCDQDEDCCAAAGECPSGHPQVCSPFESASATYCFLSCEDADVGGLEPNEYCHRYAHALFNCRSSGGGSANRKVCVP